MLKLKKTQKFSDRNFRILLVTLDEPTADQNQVILDTKTFCPKEIISFQTLFSRLFDGRHYIRIRGDHYFGSIRNPADENDFNVPPESYISTAMSEERSGRSLGAAEVEVEGRSGRCFVIFGDYGSGKSMTLRDIYLKSRERFAKGEAIQCPVYINLREHIAQINPDEALFRHAQSIGFGDTSSMISAWRAGFITLFLDGFDELTPPQFAVSISSIKQSRRLAVELVKKFIEQTPSHASIFVAGRESYFDSRAEAKSALGYGSNAVVLDITGFSDDQIAAYLKAKSESLPNWLPTRPLLLGYLANSGLLAESGKLKGLDPSVGWDNILQSVCQREVSQIWGAGSDAIELRLFLEGLATRSRQKSDSARGLQRSDLQSVFHSVFGRDADEPANLLTGRLPGLGAVPGQSGSREFIDADFADAAASGDLARFIESPFDNAGLMGVKRNIGTLGLSMATNKSRANGGMLSVAFAQACRTEEMSVSAADIISMLTEGGYSYSGEGTTLQSGNLDSLSVDADIDLSLITFKECIFSKVELGRGGAAMEKKNYPRFQDCMIGILEGVISEADIPSGILNGTTTVETFSAFSATNDAVMETDLPSSVKVLLTILRKLFLQRGSGRQYSALKRGLPVSASVLVDPIAALIRSQGFAEDVSLDRRVVIIPNRSKSREAFSIINGPNTSNHPLIVDVRNVR